MKKDMNRYAKIGIMLAIVVLMALLSFWAAASIPPQPPQGPPEQVPGDIQFYYIANTVVSTINATLSVFLLSAYVGLYKRTKSGFTLALMIVSSALLLNALTFNPYILWVFHFRGSGLGPFAMLPGLFTSVTLVVLLYLAFRY
jgi:hypothetical protein